ncbi:MAG: transporter, partial [Brevundimonas sp.]|nr:transporter [Brevundimonas sp.]
MPSLTIDDGRSAGHRALALWIVLAAQLMLSIDFLIVVVALPRIQTDLGFSAAALTWVPNGFGIAFGGLLFLGGRLGDLMGKVRAFQLGLIIFVLASLVGGFAQVPVVLIAARVLLGVGAALAAPSVLALIMVMAREEAEQARGLSLVTAVSSVGASAGLIVGGVLTDVLPLAVTLISDTRREPAARHRAFGIFLSAAMVGQIAALLFGGALVQRLPALGILAPWQTVFILAGLVGFAMIVIIGVFMSDPPREAPPPGVRDTQARSAFAFARSNARLLLTLYGGLSFLQMPAITVSGWIILALERQ